MANPKKRRKFIVFSAIGVGLLALTLVAVFKKKDPVIAVQTEKVARTNITETVKANGKIQPVIQVTISPEVSGEIIELPVKEGQPVKKGDLLLKIKPDFYIAALNQARAGYESAVAGQEQSTANLEKAQADFKRNKELFDHKLISESDFIGFKAAYDVAKAQLESAAHQVDVAKAQVASAQDSLDKTTIVSPLTGTISKLNSQLGERVLGTVQNAGTEIMIIANLNDMEARVDIGERDVVHIQPGQKARLEVDAFEDRKFNGVVTQIANSSEDLNSRGLGGGGGSSSGSQEATKFEVRIRISEKEFFRPGMSVTADIETRYRTNVVAVPLASVTMRSPKPAGPKNKHSGSESNSASFSSNSNSISSSNSLAAADPPGDTNGNATAGTNTDSKSRDSFKPIEVVFVVEGDHAKMVPVKRGIGDDNFWEITDGLTNGEEIITGGYRAVGRDLEDGKKIRKGGGTDEALKKQP
jgi:HlyD family secretion protein